MRVVILTVGSRGDIQPCLALGLGLKAAGHQVCIATERIYQEWLTQEGLEYAYLPGDTKKRLADEPWFKLLEETRDRPILSAYRAYREFLLPTLRELLDAAWDACQGADAIIGLPTVYAGSHIAEKLGIPFFGTWTCPFTPTRYFPHSWSRLAQQQWLGGTLNRFTYWVPQFLDQKMLMGTINQWRKETLNLPKMGENGVNTSSFPTLYGFSPSVVSPPPDWDNNVHVTGYWLLNRISSVQPPEDLVNFIAAGSPPVYIGFGSIGDRHATHTIQTAIDAVIKSGQRAVLETGWAQLNQLNLPPQVFKLDSGRVPHAWLFPRMAALVHHGGAGTTGQGLRNGKPTVVIYQKFTDYCFWGQRIAALGVGPEPIYIGDVTVNSLAQAIETMVTDANMQKRAALLGGQIRDEDGVARAIELFHQHANHPKATYTYA